MRAFFEKQWAQIKEYFGKMSKKRKIGLVILTLLVIILAIVVAVLLSQTNYVLLHNAADSADAGRIYTRLQDMGVPVKIEGTTRLMIPDDRGPDEIRALLASEGIIEQTQLDYSYLQEAAGFGVTDAYARKVFEIQDANDITALLLQVDRVKSALVTVNHGEKSPYLTATNLRPATASVMLRLSDGAPLTNQEVQNIAGIVRGSVQGILDENIEIHDSNLNTYKITETEEDQAEVINSRITMEELLKQQLGASVEQLLAPIFLRENIRVLPSVTLNYDKITETHVEYAAPVPGETEGIPRSKSELYRAQRSIAEAVGIPGTDENAMGMGEYPWGELGENDIMWENLMEYNYEINESLTVIERGQGIVEKLSIAVLINSEVMEEDVTEEVRNLVAMGAGVPYESISVEGLPFAEDTTWEDAQAAWDAEIARINQKDLIDTIIMWSVILLLGILFLLLLWMIFKGTKPPPPELVFAEGSPGGLDVLVGDGDENYLDELAELAEMEREEIDLQKKQSELEDIESFIEKDPAAVAQLLRNWLTDETV